MSAAGVEKFLGRGDVALGRDLGQEAAAGVSAGDVDAVDADAQRFGLGRQRKLGQHRHADGEFGNFFRRDGVGDKARVVAGGGGHVDDGFAERCAGLERTNTAAEHRPVGECHKAASRLGEDAVGRVDFRQGRTGDAGFDRQSGQRQQGGFVFVAHDGLAWDRERVHTIVWTLCAGGNFKLRTICKLSLDE